LAIILGWQVLGTLVSVSRLWIESTTTPFLWETTFSGHREIWRSSIRHSGRILSATSFRVTGPFQPSPSPERDFNDWGGLMKPSTLLTERMLISGKGRVSHLILVLCLWTRMPFMGRPQRGDLLLYIRTRRFAGRITTPIMLIYLTWKESGGGIETRTWHPLNSCVHLEMNQKDWITGSLQARDFPVHTFVPMATVEDLTPKEVERFWSYVDKSNPEGCWEWLKFKDYDGYGIFVAQRTNFRTHRLSYRLKVGVITAEKPCICHHCDNPSCVNPAHLFAGTVLDNARDKVLKGRQPKGDTNGARLHPECLARGDRSGARLHPEKLKRGVDNSASKLTPEEVIQIRREYEETPITIVQLALKYGVSKSLVSVILRGEIWAHVREGLEKPKIRSKPKPEGCMPRGETSASSKLTDSLVMSIRSRVSAGEKQKVLAKELGVSTSLISVVVKRTSWKHLP
jgi:hypothetical protein